MPHTSDTIQIQRIDIDFTILPEYPICLKLLINGHTCQALQEVAASRSLHWEVEPIDVALIDGIELRIYENCSANHKIKIGMVKFRAHQLDPWSSETKSVSPSKDVKDTKILTRLGTAPLVNDNVGLVPSIVKFNFSRRAVPFLLLKHEELRSASINSASRGLKIFRKACDLAFTILEAGPPALSRKAEYTLDLCQRACETLERQDKYDKLVVELIIGMNETLPPTDAVGIKAKTERLRVAISGLLQLLQEASRFTIEYKSDGAPIPPSSTAIPSTAQEQVNTLIEGFEKLRVEFNIGMVAQLVLGLDTTDLYSNVNQKMIKGMITPGANYDPSAKCLDGTRTKIQNDIRQWANVCTSEASKPVFWLRGLSGCGKSAVAHSICQWLEETGRLAGAFFCKEDHEDLRSPENVVSTLAASLALTCGPYATKLTEALLETPQLSDSAFALRFKGMLVDPLQALDKKLLQSPLVVVVDGVDECGTPDTRFRFIKCLLELSRLAPWLKLMIMCRGPADFQDNLEKTGNGSNVLQYDMIQEDSATTTSDIRLYIHNRLAQLVDSEHEAVVQIDQPDDTTIEELIVRSNGLFVYAQVACSFICNSSHPKETIQALISGEPEESRIKQLHSLYSSVITNARGGGMENLHTFRSCIAIITTVRVPLTDHTLAKLLVDQVTLNELRLMIRLLDPVLYRDCTGLTRIRHRSFGQYIVNEQCSGDYRIDPDDENLELAILCLQTMIKDLRYNICKLEDSTLFNHEIPDLASRIQTNITSHLQYSCLYWSSHLALSPAFKSTLRRHYSVTALLDRLLLGPKGIFWIEVLSLLGKLPAGEKNLFELIDWMKDPSHRISTHAQDIQRFISAFSMPITQSTPHLYVTAIAFGAVRFEAFQKLLKDFPNILQITRGKHLGKLSNVCSKTIELTFHPQAIACSPNGKLIVTCDYRYLHVWNARTGSAILNPLPVADRGATAVGFSPDSQRIIACTLGEPLVWDIQTDTTTHLLMKLPWHRAMITSVAFSPDGKSVASGSQDATVFVWDPNTGTTILGPLEGHTDQVTSVALSSDGRYIVSGSLDKTVRMWTLQTGVATIGPLQGHTDGVTSVAISPDCKYIASGSRDESVRLWDARTGTLVLDARQGHSGPVKCVTFSPNSQYVASGCWDGMLRIWSPCTGAPAFDPIQYHFESVECLAFSDPYHLVCGTWKGVYMCDLRAGGTAQGHSDTVRCVAFSPNSQMIVTGSSDKTAKVWDLHSDPARLTAVEKHSSVVNHVSFTPDGNRILARSYENMYTPTAVSPDGQRIASASWTRVTYAAVPGCNHSEWIPLKSWDHKKLGPPPTEVWDTRQESHPCLRVWDLPTKSELFDPGTGHSRDITCLAFSPDGQRVVSGSGDNTLWVWDINTGAAISGPLKGHSEYVTCVAVSTDSLRIISGSADTTLWVWDLRTGTLARDALEGHSSRVECVAFSPDGQYAVSGTFQELWLWDLSTGTILHSLRGRYHTVKSVAFSPNGGRIASTSSSADTVRVWDISTMNLFTDLLPPDFPHSIPTPYVPSYQLANLLNNDDWVLDSNKKPIFWLPKEYQRSEIDNSLLAISCDLADHPVLFDFSKFRHGTVWTSICDTITRDNHI